MNGWLSSFKFVFHQKNLIKRVLNLVLYKIEFLILKFKSYLLKPKFKILNEMIFFFEHSYKSFSTKFLDQHDIKVALHKYVSQN